ncbi:hypothetical protein D3Y57_14355 [Sphingomonas paeninsulae]|uniref:Uncharacterized protein n=1 Tax=Sphingomonas paeninsulae TaxID=2319844 RepID=A0A494TPA4_SPHPE|nr:hypothetical protein [Sphingomonas paeninsulae]AYJ86905.1 hypothetical protein D3Y57_14355 [Sphingomonas paeninsulae]
MAQATNPIGVRSVGFINPTDPTGSAIDAQQIERQQELADAFQQRALTPIQVQSGNISWTQGLAQLADAIAGNHLRRQANASQWDAGARAQNARSQLHYGAGAPQIDSSTNPYSSSEQGRNLGQRLKDFVSGGPPVASHAALAQALIAQRQTPSAAPAAAPQNPASDVSNLAAALTAKPPLPANVSPVQASVAPIAPAQVGPPPIPTNGPGGANDPTKPVMGISIPARASSLKAPADPSQSGGATGQQIPVSPMNAGAGADTLPTPAQRPRDQLMPTMSADQGMYAEANDPQEFWKGVIASAQPTDVVKNLVAQGLTPGAPEFAKALGT